MPSYIFPDEVHNEDAHYSRLAIGFLQSSNEHQIPLRFTDPELEAKLFPDLFPDVTDISIYVGKEWNQIAKYFSFIHWYCIYETDSLRIA